MTGGRESFTNLDEHFSLLEYNLLSVGQLMNKGYTITFDNGVCSITNKGIGATLMSIKAAKNNMFIMDPTKEENQPQPAQINQDSDSSLWHLRYGHFHFQGIKTLSDKRLVYGLPSISSSDPYEGCILGKSNQMPYSSHSWKATKPLELLHVDVCGPMQVASMGGSHYYFLLIDDFTRMSWIYLLKSKSETFEKFKVFKAFVEKESEHCIKVLRTDRGGEFCSLECNTYCETNGIKRELAIPYTPQHNGVVERRNRTIMGMVRSMLKERSLPNSLWAEGAATAVYLLNRATTKVISDKTPDEAWYGRKPSVYHLRIFGCVAYGHIPVNLRKKLDDRAEKCIFIGYSQESKEYRLYNPISKKFFSKRNVVFIENDRWKWNDNKETSNPFPVYYHDDHDVSYVNDGDSTPPHEPTLSIPPLPIVQNNPSSSNSPSNLSNLNQPFLSPATHATSPSHTSHQPHPLIHQTHNSVDVRDDAERGGVRLDDGEVGFKVDCRLGVFGVNESVDSVGNFVKISFLLKL
ncbi:hypothetical protein E3N88_08806 [Mikania micrantha]|uniref:Integrase catalytic domain-containing protein n=1 Tax=Mikania micrantha TaxID=192012 RepID=A0A5N6PH88_9ASTR|nr:hypothetical protein E3N88_08806 [Mikania micrantha]